MALTIKLAPEIEAVLLAQARQNGISLEAFAEQVLSERSRSGANTGGPEYANAIRRLATFGKRHKLSLGGITVKDLLRESRP